MGRGGLASPCELKARQVFFPGDAANCVSSLGARFGVRGGEMGAVCYRCRTGASVGTRHRAPARCWGLGLSLRGGKSRWMSSRHHHHLAEGCWGAADLPELPGVRQKSPQNGSLNGQSTPGTRNTPAGVELGARMKQAGGSSATPCSPFFFVSLHHFGWVCAFCSPPRPPQNPGDLRGASNPHPAAVPLTALPASVLPGPSPCSAI